MFQKTNLSLKELFNETEHTIPHMTLGEYLLPYYMIYLNCDHPILDKYKTEDAIIKDNVKISFVPSIMQAGTFYHELAHYLQIIATSDGIRFLALYSRSFDIAMYLVGISIYDQTDKTQNLAGITLRLPILSSLKNTPNNRDDNLIETINFFVEWYDILNNDIYTYQGFEISTENRPCSPDLLNVALIETETGIHPESIHELKMEKAKALIPLVEVGYNGNIVKKVILGSRHINEGSARVISNIFGAKETNFNLRMLNDLYDPSLSDYNLSFRIFSDALRGSGHLTAEEFVVVSELSLMCANANISAGLAFVMILQLLKNDKSLQPFHPSDPIKFTKDIHNRLKSLGVVLDFQHMWEKQKELIVNKMDLKEAKEWEHLSILSGLYCKADTYRTLRGGVFYPILLDLISIDNHKAIYEQLPLPIVCYNNGKIHYGFNEPYERMDAHILYNMVEHDFLNQLITMADVNCPLYRLSKISSYSYIKHFCHYLLNDSGCNCYSLLLNYENRTNFKCLFWGIADKHLTGWGISKIDHS